MSMRMAASCCQPCAVIPLPRGARMTRAPLVELTSGPLSFRLPIDRMISFIQAGQALRKGAGAYMSATVVIGDADLTFGDVVAVARDGARVELSATALTALADGR